MRRIFFISSIVVFLSCIALPGCAPQFSFSPPQAAAHSPVNGIRVDTKTNGSLLFHENRWDLTMSGLSGHATVHDADGSTYEKDTTLSYWDVSSAAASGRGNTMTQFLLTILGVILVIGLAALILYAAFRATDR
jgi:hypothetical protein